VQYTRNMVTGASTADLALILVDARQGLVQQSRRHACLSALLGIRHLVLCVNKMDLVDWSQERFAAIAGEFARLAARLGVADGEAIPISALHGDNVVSGSAAAAWYDGPTVLEHLERVEVARDRNLDEVRFPVQWTVRAEDYRGYAGKVAGGVLSAGDEVAVLPQGAHTRIERLDTYDGPVERAFPPMAVTVVLADELDVGRGDMIVRREDAPVLARELTATVCWMVDEPAREGGRYLLKHTTRRVRATIESVEGRVDVDSGESHAGAELALNDIGTVRLRTSAPVLADPYDRNRATGAFILIDELTHDTVAAGMVATTIAGEPAAARRSPDVTWHDGELERPARWAALGQAGATVWLTGLPASGKSTIATALERSLVEAGRIAYRLDGDNIRHGLSGDLGFDRASRSENMRRVAHVARLFADAGAVALVCLVSPFHHDRLAARHLHDAAGLAFVEVFVDTPVSECARRDPKGLYARSRSGRLAGLTGAGAPYEPPDAPELVIRTTEQSVDAAVDAILALLPGAKDVRRGA
jgi:bifunctional enzyme CysN/CysC